MHNPADALSKNALLDVLDRLRSAAERLLRQRRLHERVKIAVEHAAGIGRGNAGAQILHHLIGLQHVGADLVPPTDVRLGGMLGGGLLFPALQLTLVKPSTEHRPSLSAVAML